MAAEAAAAAKEQGGPWAPGCLEVADTSHRLFHMRICCRSSAKKKKKKRKKERKRNDNRRE